MSIDFKFGKEFFAGFSMVALDESAKLLNQLPLVRICADLVLLTVEIEQRCSICRFRNVPQRDLKDAYSRCQTPQPTVPMDLYSAEEHFAREQDQKKYTCFRDFSVIR